MNIRVILRSQTENTQTENTQEFVDLTVAKRPPNRYKEIEKLINCANSQWVGQTVIPEGLRLRSRRH